MKLLFDENLSRRLCSMLASEFPETAHLWHVNLLKADDLTIWEFAGEQGYTIVSKDSDFYERSFLHGHPPKVVWIRADDASTDEIADLLRRYTQDLARFDQDPSTSFLIMP